MGPSTRARLRRTRCRARVGLEVEPHPDESGCLACVGGAGKRVSLCRPHLPDLDPAERGLAAQRSRSFGLLLSLALNMVPLAVKQFVEIREDSWKKAVRRALVLTAAHSSFGCLQKFVEISGDSWIRAVKVALVLTAAHSSFGGYVDSWIKQLR
jgi:hypothetical protein